MKDNVNHPAHYTQWPIEAINLTEREDFLYGNILKYALRAGAKPGSTHEEDIAKATWYAVRFVANTARVTSVADGLRALRSHRDNTIAYLASRQEDTTEMRKCLQGRLAAIYNQTKKEMNKTWDAT